MALYELTLRGFNGASDETDHLIIWVESPMSETETKKFLSGSGLYRPDGLVTETIAIPEVTSADQADFVLPDQIDGLISRVRQVVFEHERSKDCAAKYKSSLA